MDIGELTPEAEVDGDQIPGWLPRDGREKCSKDK
jgi:hypothetical protein